MRLDRGKPLVPKLNRQAGRPFERRGKIAHPGRLPPFGSAHIHGVTHQNFARPALAGKGCQRGKICAFVRPFQVGETLCANAQWIADRQPNSSFSEV